MSNLNIQITHTGNCTHSQNPYLHIQAQIQLQGHRRQSIISLIFHSLSLSLQLSHFTHSAVCDSVTVWLCVCWHRLLAVCSEHLHLVRSEHLSTSVSHSHILTHMCTLVCDWQTIFLSSRKAETLGCKRMFSPSLFLPPSLIPCSSPYQSSSFPLGWMYVCVCSRVCEYVNARLLQLPAFHWNVI